MVTRWGTTEGGLALFTVEVGASRIEEGTLEPRFEA